MVTSRVKMNQKKTQKRGISFIYRYMYRELRTSWPNQAYTRTSRSKSWVSTYEIQTYIHQTYRRISLRHTDVHVTLVVRRKRRERKVVGLILLAINLEK